MAKYEDERFIHTKKLGLNKTVARCAIVVTEKNPKTREDHIAVSTVVRPYWSAQGAGEKSLVGGKINDSDIQAAEIPFDQRQVNIGESTRIARITAHREVKQEIGVELTLDQLVYVGLFQNGEWATALFYVLLDKLPAITIGETDDDYDEIDGYVWVGADRAGDDATIFADHKLLIAEAVSEATGAKTKK